MSNKHLAYGEVTYTTLAKVIIWIEKSGYQKPGGIFYDVGHGAGKGLIAAALFGGFSQIKGIELLDGLYYVSLRQKELFFKNSTQVTLKPEDI